MIHELWRSYLPSDHVSIPNTVYTRMAIGACVGQSLNAKCGLADASTSTEIRNESTRGLCSTPNPRGRVQITADPLQWNHRPSLHDARKTLIMATPFTVTQRLSHDFLFHFTTDYIRWPDGPGVCAKIFRSLRLNCSWKVIYHLCVLQKLATQSCITCHLVRKWARGIQVTVERC